MDTVARFDKGIFHTITLVDKSTTGVGLEIGKLAAALQRQITEHFMPVWGVGCNLQVTPELTDDWGILFIDDPDTEGALGYHDLTPAGKPLSKVFTKLASQSPGGVSVTASHELCEMLIDPSLALCVAKNDGTIYAYETADPCEEETYQIDGVNVSDFVFPSWFEEFHAPGSTQFDYLNKITAPFQLLPGGYMPVMTGGKWTQIFGSLEKAKSFGEEDRRGHRSEYHKAQLTVRN